MRRTTQISLVFGAVIAGAALGRVGVEGSLALTVVALAGAMLARPTRLFLTCLMLAALLTGLWRATA